MGENFSTSIGQINVVFGFQSKQFNRVRITRTKKFDYLIKRVNSGIGLNIYDLLEVGSHKNVSLAICSNPPDVNIGIFVVRAVCVAATQPHQNNVIIKVGI